MAVYVSCIHVSCHFRVTREYSTNGVCTLTFHLPAKTSPQSSCHTGCDLWRPWQKVKTPAACPQSRLYTRQVEPSPNPEYCARPRDIRSPHHHTGAHFGAVKHAESVASGLVRKPLPPAP